MPCAEIPPPFNRIVIHSMKRDGSDLSIIITASNASPYIKGGLAKPLISFAGENLLTRQIRLLKNQYPLSEIIVVIGYQADLILKGVDFKNNKIKVVESELFAQYNIARSVSLGLRITSHENVLILNGNLVFNKEAISRFPTESYVVCDSFGQFKQEEIGCTVIDKYVSCFAYGLPTKWAQILFLTGRELNLFWELGERPESRKLYTFEVLNKMIEQGAHLRAVEPKDMKIVEVETNKDVEIARHVAV